MSQEHCPLLQQGQMAPVQLQPRRVTTRSKQLALALLQRPRLLRRRPHRAHRRALPTGTAFIPRLIDSLDQCEAPRLGIASALTPGRAARAAGPGAAAAHPAGGGAELHPVRPRGHAADQPLPQLDPRRRRDPGEHWEGARRGISNRRALRSSSDNMKIDHSCRV